MTTLEELEDRRSERDNLPEELSSEDTLGAIRNKTVEIELLESQLEAANVELSEGEDSKKAHEEIYSAQMISERELDLQKKAHNDEIDTGKTKLSQLQGLVAEGGIKFTLLEEKLCA